MVDYQVYVGTAGPFNFNGLVRHYYLRQGRRNLADIQVNLAGKRTPPGTRAMPSPNGSGRRCKTIADRYGARVKVAEVPPGPPVLSTLVAEVYGPDYDRQRELAREIMDDFRADPRRGGRGLVHGGRPDALPARGRTSEKAALNGISVAQITSTLQ